MTRTAKAKKRKRSPCSPIEVSPINEAKKCEVCGDVAVGFNFSGLTCEPCKAFFRRNAPRKRELNCQLSGECHIDMQTRKYCKCCRLEKCFAIGMKMELIWSEGKHKMKPSDVKQLPLNYELERLKEVQQAMKVAFGAPLANDKESVRSIESTDELIQLAESFVHNTVKFCRNLSAFKCLPLDDQVLLLKAAHPELTLVYIGFEFDSVANGFAAIVENEHAIINFDTVKRLVSYKCHKKLCSSVRECLNCLKRAVADDCLVRDLLMAQLVLKPRPGVVSLEYLTYSELVYGHLLRRYLERDQSPMGGQWHSVTSVLAADGLRRASEAVRTFYLRLLELSSPLGASAPLLAEMYHSIPN